MNALTALQQLLSQRGEIPFVEFMQHALYHPHYGYYSSGLAKFGHQGDFITAPELTPLFGQTLAQQCQSILSQLDSPVLFEFGAGSGQLCVDLMKQLEQMHCLPQRYFILEVSGQLRQRQQQKIEQSIPHLAEQITWLDRWPEQAITGVMIANEVLDAMPVHRFLQTATQCYESVISFNKQNELIEQFKPCTNPRLLSYLDKVFTKTLDPYHSEANLFLESWLAECAKIFKQGAFFIIDYGFPRHEYYHPDRNQGTLMCHYQHRSHSNPLLHVGEQDISSHVDFTQVAEAGQAAGFNIAGYTNQASFLLANGLLSLVEQIDDELQATKAKQAVKILLQPSEMGELFKVIALTKALEFPLQGFQLSDKRASL